MKKALIILLQHVVSFAALSVMAFSRTGLGQDVWLPWGIKVEHVLGRIVLRMWTALMLFVWVRIFFLIEIYRRSDPAPFDTSTSLWDLFTAYNFQMGFGVHLFFYYYSFMVVILALLHIISLEFYYKAGTAVSHGSLGNCLLSGKMEGKRIMGCTIDKFLIWGLIEPFIITSIGTLLYRLTQYPVLAWFFITAGTAMFIQGQFARLEHRLRIADIQSEKIKASSIRQSNNKFSQKGKKPADADGARIA